MSYPSPNGGKPAKRKSCPPRLLALPLIILFLLARAGLRKVGIVK